MRLRLLLVFCVVLLSGKTWSQVVESNVGNIRDPRILLVNPAVNGWNRTMLLVAGYERYYLGFPGDSFQSGFAAITHPVGSLGSAGLSVQYFSSDIFRQGLYSLTFGRAMWQNRLCLGFEVGVRSIAYNEANFYALDPGDPVFLNQQSKNVLEVGISGLFRAAGPVVVGFAARHLNEPNVSLIDEAVYAPVNIQAGIKLEHTPISPLFNVGYEDSEYDLDYGVESWFLAERAMLRATYGHEDFRFGAAYVFDSPNRVLRLDYEFRYPTSELNDIADGFHQFVLSYSPGVHDGVVMAGDWSEQVVRDRPRLSGAVVASTDTLLIEERVRIRRENPLLAQIFFAENGFALDSGRYEILNPERNPLQDFVFFPGSLVDIPAQYRNTLNIVARRLWDNPELSVTLTGCNSGWGSEQGDLDLSLKRAEVIRDYLVENCGVHPDQITVQARQMPEYPADSSDRRGREENQRVEISGSGDFESRDGADRSGQATALLAPVITETVELTTSHSLCVFELVEVVAEAGLDDWTISIEWPPGQLFKDIRGQALPIRNPTWNWRGESGEFVTAGNRYDYRLYLADSQGQTFVSPPKSMVVVNSTLVEEELMERVIEVTRLILFKYDNAELDLTSTSLRGELDRIVARLQELPDATLEVKGHTDIIGSAAYNHDLSERRAAAVVAYCQQQGIAASRISAEGFGSTLPIMDNELPEGRMINRRVEIHLIHPAR
ncbi:MAG: OmpA family protein [bacterium]